MAVDHGLVVFLKASGIRALAATLLKTLGTSCLWRHSLLELSMQQQRCDGLRAVPLAGPATCRPSSLVLHRLQQPRLTAVACRQRRRLSVCTAQQVDRESAASPPLPPPPAADGSPHAPQLECFGTGMEVECRLVVDNVDGHAAPPEIAAQEAAAAAAQQEATGRCPSVRKRCSIVLRLAAMCADWHACPNEGMMACILQAIVCHRLLQVLCRHLWASRRMRRTC